VLRDRKVDTRRFKFQHRGPISNSPVILSRPAEEIFVPSHIGPQGFQFEEVTLRTDNYEADQKIYAGYAMADLPVTRTLSLNGGVRVEHSDQEVQTFELFSPEKVPIVSKLENTDPLPALTATWRFAQDMLVRAGFSQTVNRPDFRELSPAVYNDVIGGRQVQGNPDLERALIRNFDIRWEWYPRPVESFSVGFFFKDFTDPIENVILPGSTPTITYANASGATNLGVELEFRKTLGFMAHAVRDFYLYGNFAYIDSEVDLGDNPGAQTSKERPLQGQAPYVVNATLGYDNADTQSSVALIYNVVGKRIAEVGARGLPDVYLQPFQQLDFVGSQGLGKGFSIKFKAKNLLDDEVELTQGGQPYENWKPGREFTLSFRYKH
jgi:TonB-dependent receptor